ncbi:MAG: rod shape-determining protein RodA [Vulcanimicrobiaceae bacterium]
MAVTPVLITLLGIACIQSADFHERSVGAEYAKQALFGALGIGVMLVCSQIDYRNWRRLWPYIYALNVLLLLFILVAGHRALGAQRWISLGPLGTFQPSEPAKLVVAISLAAVLCRGSYDRLRDLLRPLLAVALPALLILKQPDLGTTLVLLGILTAQLFLGLPKLRHFAVFAGGVIAVAAFTALTNVVLKPFQKARLFVFLNPHADPQGAGYNLDQSKIAVGNGQLLGRGFHHGTQTQLNFVPEHSRDFIFTVLAEEFGFLGSLVLLVLYGVVLYGGIRTMLVARDRFGFLLAGGIVAMLTFHILVNIGMTIGIMPITGIPLPFMSYGGSALLTDFASIGVLLNIYSQKDRDLLGNA